MARAYSTDLRERVMGDLTLGMSVEAVSEKYSVCIRTIYDWRKLFTETGHLQPRSGKTGPKLKLEAYREEILAAIEENSSLTLTEIHERFQLPGCLQTLWHALRRWGIVLKKSHESHRTTSGRCSGETSLVGHSG